MRWRHTRFDGGATLRIMKQDPEPGKLRLVPPETPEELALRYDREKRAMLVQREDGLLNSLAPFRVGTVSFLNGAPLNRGLEDQLIYAVPSELAARLRRGELDAALVSITEVLLNDGYDILDGVAIASLGEVQSVFLAHRGPIEAVNEVYCDPASLASVNLLRVLLAERGLHPEFKPLPRYDLGNLPDYTLLIGDVALDFLLGERTHQIWDLGTAWYDSNRLPFVYAVWALRRGQPNQVLRQRLREAKDFGLETLDSIVGNLTQYTYAFRKDYLGWHIHYHLGADEKRGIARFCDLLRKHGLGPVYEPRFVA